MEKTKRVKPETYGQEYKKKNTQSNGNFGRCVYKKLYICEVEKLFFRQFFSQLSKDFKEHLQIKQKQFFKSFNINYVRLSIVSNVFPELKRKLLSYFTFYDVFVRYLMFSKYFNDKNNK